MLNNVFLFGKTLRPPTLARGTKYFTIIIIINLIKISEKIGRSVDLIYRLLT